PTVTDVGAVQLPNPQGATGSVDLGNGATVPATLTPNADGTFTVSAPLAYHSSGDYQATIKVVVDNGLQMRFNTNVTVTPGPNEKYVDQLYHDLLARTPDDGGLAFWTAALDNGLPRSTLAAVLQ